METNVNGAKEQLDHEKNGLILYVFCIAFIVCLSTAEKNISFFSAIIYFNIDSTLAFISFTTSPGNITCWCMQHANYIISDSMLSPVGGENFSAGGVIITHC